MALMFIAIDPETDSDHCPAVFVEEESGDLLFQGWTVTDPATLAEVSRRSPVADNESVVRLPARMRATILEALSGHGATVQRVDRRDRQLGGSPRDEGRVHTDDQRFLDWLAGKPLPCPANPAWSQLVRTHTARGVRFRRARVVSEPLADYIRFEYAITDEVNVSAGEEVRWLPRRRASDLRLPGNDFWLFDDRLIRFSYFSGDGYILEDELVADTAVAGMCSAAFEAVWDRSTPHAEYRPT